MLLIYLVITYKADTIQQGIHVGMNHSFSSHKVQWQDDFNLDLLGRYYCRRMLWRSEKLPLVHQRHWRQNASIFFLPCTVAPFPSFLNTTINDFCSKVSSKSLAYFRVRRVQFLIVFKQTCFLPEEYRDE